MTIGRSGLARLAAFLILTTLPAFAGAQSSASTPAESVPARPAIDPRALALAHLTVPTELNIAAELRAAKQGFYAAFRAEANAAELESAHPGLFDAIWAAVAPAIEKDAREDLPGFRDKVAALYTARLTLREIEALHGFYSTPTGRKLIEGMYRNIDIDPLVAEVVESGGGPVSAGTANAAVKGAARTTVAGMSAEDHRVGNLLARSISMDKLARLGAEVQRLALVDANTPDPELDARLDEIAADVIGRFMADPPAGH